MEFKRYDNSNFQRFRDQALQGREDPSLDDVVAGILGFLQEQGIVEDGHRLVSQGSDQRNCPHV
jgi:hypothetical protein